MAAGRLSEAFRGVLASGKAADQAAVDRQHYTGNIRGGLGTEKGYRCGKFLRTAETAGRDDRLGLGLDLLEGDSSLLRALGEDGL